MRGVVERDPLGRDEFGGSDRCAAMMSAKDRDPLLEGEVAKRLLAAVLNQAEVKGLLSEEHAELEKRAVDALVAHGAFLGRAPRAFPSALSVSDWLLEGPVEIAVVGPRGREDTEALQRAIAATFLPNRVLSPVDPADAERSLLGR